MGTTTLPNHNIVHSKHIAYSNCFAGAELQHADRKYARDLYQGEALLALASDLRKAFMLFDFSQ